MPKISVIVPVYKVEKYLDRCIQSILRQTYADFELILVDDGSPDHCGEMCDEWAKKDERIHVVHKANGGLSSARNAGIDVAQGEWLTFIDSDDYVHPRMLEALYNAVCEHDTKVSICGYIETCGEPLIADSIITKVWDLSDFYQQYNANATIACAKLYHKSVVLPYPLDKLHEDEYVTYRILFKQEKIVFVETALYGYFKNNCGITKGGWNTKKMDVIEAISQQIEFFARRGDKVLWRFSIRKYVNTIFWQIYSIDNLPDHTRYQKERKLLLWKGRKAMLRSLPKKVFWGEKDMSTYGFFFPRTIGMVRKLHTIRKKS